MAKLMVGSRVHCMLYGGKDGVVYAIHGEQAPGTVHSVFHGMMVTGGNAEFDIVWENGTESHRTPEAIILGVQWRILEGFCNAETIAFMREFAASEEVRKKVEAKAAAEKFSAEVAAMKINPVYAHLEQVQKYGSCGKLVGTNLRREFKKLFPGVKFSVTKSHHGSVRIEWTDGPTTAQVKEVTGKYSGGHFDGMEDIYRPSRSPFTEVFGSAQYISETRNHSPEALKEAVREISLEYGWPLVEVKINSDGSAYVPDRYVQENQQVRKIYDWIEKR